VIESCAAEAEVLRSSASCGKAREIEIERERPEHGEPAKYHDRTSWRPWAMGGLHAETLGLAEAQEASNWSVCLAPRARSQAASSG
jgi:hypothetical protein